MNNLLLDHNSLGRFAWLEASNNATRMATRLDALVLYLKFCHGTTCRFSWSHLFPYGEAKNLEEAMGASSFQLRFAYRSLVADHHLYLDPRFDSYFDSLPKVEYSTCQLGFHLDLEWPYWTTNMAYSENVEYGDAELTGNKMLRARDPRMVAWWDVPTGY